MGQAITKEIPRQEWRAFFDGFSRQYNGWLVTVEVMSEEFGDQFQARDVPLDGVFVDRGNVDDPDISIALRGDGGIAATHLVHHPWRVRLEQSETGIAQALQIESQDSGTTLLSFRAGPYPEQLDDIGPSRGH